MIVLAIASIIPSIVTKNDSNDTTNCLTIIIEVVRNIRNISSIRITSSDTGSHFRNNIASVPPRSEATLRQLERQLEESTTAKASESHSPDSWYGTLNPGPETLNPEHPRTLNPKFEP